MERTEKYFWPIKLILNNQSSFKKDSRVNIILGDAFDNLIKQKNNFYDLILID